MGSEKRRFERFEIAQMVDIAFPRETFFHADGVNLSEGGMLCRTSYDLDPLSQIFCMVSLPREGGDYMLKTRGTVIHTRQEGDEILFGVSFDELTDEDRKVLHEFIASLDAAP